MSSSAKSPAITKAAEQRRAADAIGAADGAATAAPNVHASSAGAVLAASIPRRVQPKLVVGAVDDPLEAEADRMASAVVSRIQTGAAVTANRVEEEEPLQGSRIARAESAVGADGGTVDPALEARLTAGSGSPLPEPIRARMEAGFGADFSAVRIAETSATREIGARAYATGTTVRFAPGEFEPDTPAGQHLIAHELAHVVQQGGAVRRDPTALDEAIELGDSASSKADDTAGLVDASSDVHNDLQPGDDGSAVTGGISGLVTGVFGLMSAYQNLMARMKDGSTEDQLTSAHDGLVAAGDVVKGALDIASGAGATIVGTVVPGIDLAYGLLAAMRAALQLFYLRRASAQQNAQIEAAAGDPKLQTALQTAQSRTDRKSALTLVQLAGDIGLAVGAAAQLAAGPFGTAVKLGAIVVKLAGGVAGILLQHAEAKATNKARAGYDAAVASGDGKKIEKATMTRLGADAAFAVREIITKGTTPTDPANPKSFDEGMVSLLATYGVTRAWLNKWVDGGRKRDELVKAEDIVLRFIGTDRDPKTLGGMLQATLASVTNFFTKLFSSTPDAAKTVIPSAAIRAAAMKDAGPLADAAPDATPAQLTSRLAALFARLVKEHNPTNDDDTHDLVVGAIDAGFERALAYSLRGRTVRGSLKVLSGQVQFTPLVVKSRGRAMATV